MKSITILCPSSLDKDQDIKLLHNKYTKRLSAHIDWPKLNIKLHFNDSADLVKKKQGEALLQAIEKWPQNSFVIALDENGKYLSSLEFAEELENKTIMGQSHFCFIIGGAYGLPDSILDKCDLKLSFGKMVWPHRLVSVMLLEQLYRAQQILAGHPYHKE